MKITIDEKDKKPREIFGDGCVVVSKDKLDNTPDQVKISVGVVNMTTEEVVKGLAIAFGSLIAVDIDKLSDLDVQNVMTDFNNQVLSTLEQSI